MTNADRKPRLEEVLKTLYEKESVDFNGTLILGEIIGNLGDGGYLEPGSKYKGTLTVTKEQHGYGFQFADESKITDIQTDRGWLLRKGSLLCYATILRRRLRTTPHLILGTDNTNQAHHFAILHYDRNHQ